MAVIGSDRVLRGQDRDAWVELTGSADELNVTQKGKMTRQTQG